MLHCHLGTYSAYPVIVEHRIGFPVVNTFHNTRFPPQTHWLKLPVLRNLRQIVIMSHIAQRGDLFEFGCGYSR